MHSTSNYKKRPSLELQTTRPVTSHQHTSCYVASVVLYSNNLNLVIFIVRAI